MNCPLCSRENLKTIYGSGSRKVLSCAGCGLIFLHPFPEPDTLGGLYDDDYFKICYLPEDRLKAKREFYKGELDRIRRHAQTGRSLDVGCSVGTFMEVAAEGGWDVRGIDIAEFAVETARKTFGDRVRLGALSDLTFGNDVFDLITFWDTLEHMPDPVSALRIARGKLRDSGLLVIKVPNTVKILFHVVKVLKLLGLNAESPIVHIPTHLFHYRRESIERLLSETGFEVAGISFLNEKKAQLTEHTYPTLNAFKRMFFYILHLMNYKESMIIHARPATER
ncbi:MAG: class I SAM-dependent methyltransferase [bacterium]